MIATPDVSVIIVSWNTRELLRACLRSIATESGPVTLEIIVVDNASHDRSADMVAEEFPTVTILRNADNLGFAAANNQGLELATGRYALLLNSDTVVVDGAIAKAVAFADGKTNAAIVGCRTLFPDGRMQRNCFLFPSVLNVFLAVTRLATAFKTNRFFGRYRFGWWDYQSAREVDGVAGCFMLVRRSAIAHVGLMAEHYFMYAEDADWCWRFRKAGYSIWYTPDPCILHVHDASGSQAAIPMRVQYRKSLLAFVEMRSGLMARWLCNLLFLAGSVAVWASPDFRRKDLKTPANARARRQCASECIRLHARELFPWRPPDGGDPGFLERLTAFCKRLACLAVSIAGWMWSRVGPGAWRSVPTKQILYYHGVNARQQERFCKQMSWLRSTQTVTTLAAALNPRNRNAIAVTFDDGFDNVRQYAFPILQAQGIPATVFAVSCNLGRIPQWEMPQNHGDAQERLMSAESLRTACRNGVRVESHTCTHPRLALSSPAQTAEELKESKEQLERVCGAPVRFVSMPYGNWSAETMRRARETGYERVLTSEPGGVEAFEGSFAVGRTAVSPDDWSWEFRLKALGYYNWRRRLRRRRSALRLREKQNYKRERQVKDDHLATRAPAGREGDVIEVSR